MMVQVNDSQFYMWRTIFALAHADDVVSPEELRFMAEALEDIPFSEAQKVILKADTTEAQPIEEMFKRIEDPADQAEFFKFAKQIAHIDGDFGEEEQEVILRLQRLHFSTINLDELIGKVDMSFQDEGEGEKDLNFKETVTTYRQKFLSKLLGG